MPRKVPEEGLLREVILLLSEPDVAPAGMAVKGLGKGAQKIGRLLELLTGLGKKSLRKKGGESLLDFTKRLPEGSFESRLAKKFAQELEDEFAEETMKVGRFGRRPKRPTDRFLDPNSNRRVFDRRQTSDDLRGRLLDAAIRENRSLTEDEIALIVSDALSQGLLPRFRP